MKTTMKIWHNGHLIPVEQVIIDPSDRGFALGDGLFETLYCQDGAPVHLDAHLARLAEGVKILGLPLPLAWSPTRLAEALTATLAANGLREGVLRLTVTRGPGPRGLPPPPHPTPTILISAAPAPPRPESARVIIATVTRRNEGSPLSRIKSLNYLDNILARIEAEQACADDALLCNNRGMIAESTVSNVFAVIDDVLITPPIADGALPGVIRQKVCSLNAVEERSLTVDALAKASEVFLTNSLTVRAVVAVNGRVVGDGMPGPVTRRLADSRLVSC